MDCMWLVASKGGGAGASAPGSRWSRARSPSDCCHPQGALGSRSGPGRRAPCGAAVGGGGALHMLGAGPARLGRRSAPRPARAPGCPPARARRGASCGRGGARRSGRSMGSRLLPLLALLGAAGLRSSEWEGSPAQEPSTAPEREHPFPGSTEPRPSSSSQSPVANSLPFSSPSPSLATFSADSEVSPGGVPSGATAMEHGSALGTAGGRTQPPTPDAGGAERTRAPSALGTSLQPQPMSPSVATRFLTLFPMLALLPGSTSPEEVAAPTSGHSSTSEGFRRSGPEGRAAEGWPATVPFVLQDTWEWVSSRARWTLTPEPGSKSTAGAASAGNAASSVVSVEELRTLAAGGPWLSGASSWMSQESETSPPTDTQGTPLVPTWPAARDTTDPVSTVSFETLGPEGAAATSRTLSMRLPPPHERSSSSSLVAGLELLPRQPGGSQAHAQLEVTPGLDLEAEPMEPEVAVGPLSPGTAVPQSLEGTGHLPKVADDAAVPDSTGGSTSSAAVTRALPPSPALPSSAATPKEGAYGTKVAPFSSGATVPLALVDSTVYPSGSDHTLYGNSPTPGPSLSTLSVGPARLPADVTERPGTLGPRLDAGLVRTIHQRCTDLPPVSSSGPLWTVVPQDGPAITTGETWGSRETLVPSEPFSTWSVQSPPGPTHFALQGVLSGLAHSSPEPSASPAESGWWVPTDSRREAQEAPAIYVEQPVREGSTSEAAPPQTTDGTSVGTVSRKVQSPASQVASRSGSLAGSEIALLSTEGVTLKLVHSAHDPELSLSQSTALPTSAAPTSATAAAAASSRLQWTLRPAAPPAGTPWWEWGRRPSAPTESSLREEPAPSSHSKGPAQTTATSGPLESSWNTWPPLPAPEPGGASGGGPAIASTWLVAPVPEDAHTRPAPAVPDDTRGRGRRVFVAENQPPLLKAAFLHVPCELVLAMEFSRSFQNPHSAEYQGLVLSINETVAPLLASLPGFQRLEVKTIRPGSVVVEFDALFRAEASGLWATLNRSWLAERLPPELWVADARVLWSTTLERHLDLCAVLFSCHAGYECIAGEDGDAVCTSQCHRDYCQNQGICTHEVNHIPVCQCPVGSDFWFLGMRCNYKVTQQGLLGVACGLLLSLVVVGTAIAGLVIRRVRTLLLEARADQTKSSYRRFCRLDDVSAHYWSEPWLASASSLDNPAFSNSEELLHLQILDTNCCSCQDNCMAPNCSCKQLQDTPCISAAGRPSPRYNWDTSSNSVNDPMIDSGKASEVSVSSWPLEPIQWSPFPAPHKLSEQQANQFQRPHSYCEGMELVNLERSWTA
ncbi:mucin-2-like [Tiliqua scincoides]|uniref:mucin-2-like n=1 Tax=Tiliqua scincoides TaxID=71010 RepID=UPI003462AE3B